MPSGSGGHGGVGSGLRRLEMSRKNHPTKRWYPQADEISPEAISGPGRPEVDVDVGSGLAPKKNSPFKNYAPNTRPPLGRALPVRGEHNENDRDNSQSEQ
jgi:hypothetical protein